MRDGHVMQMHQANAKRNALLLGQFEFLQTRQEAMERVMRVSTLMDRMRWLLAPTLMLQVVDAVQQTLLAARQEEMRAAAAKPKIQVVA